MANFYLHQGNRIRFISADAIKIVHSIPVGVYTVMHDPMQGFFLELNEPFSVPAKMYGSTEQDAARILNTFNDRKGATGVLLAGEKGSGKTMLAKLISIQAAQTQGIPTIIVNSAFSGDEFNSFIASITQDIILVFDEFEKVYDDDKQNGILTLMDGLYNAKRLYILTCNDRFRVNRHMMNRPGRLYYMLEYSGIDHDFIIEYCQDNLGNRDHIKTLCNLSNLFEAFNFDMLQSVVEEMNRYGETPQEVLRMLNCKVPQDIQRCYEVSLSKDGVAINKSHFYETLYATPLNKGFFIDVRTDSKTVTRDVLDDLLESSPFDNDEDGESAPARGRIRLRFQPEDIVAYNGLTGTLALRTEGYEIVLQEKRASNVGVNHLLAL